MGESISSISTSELGGRIGSRDCPVIIDVRRPPAFAEADTMIPTARWRDLRLADEWIGELPDDTDIVVYCLHGHEMSQSAVAHLQTRGRRAHYLAGGIEAYAQDGGPLIRKAALPAGDSRRPSRWITRERPKIDRIACPWLIRRFVDRDAVFYFVASESVATVARELEAVPFDIPGVDFSHDGERCSFDAFIARFGLVDPALDQLAIIVRGADTARLDLAPQAAGLLAASLGLSAICPDDREMLKEGMLLYDALYGWCRSAASETHGWPPRA